MCAPFCLERWTEGQAQPDAEYERRRQKMLLVYPVPDGWQEVYDPGTGRHFYWSLESDRVSWFPPGHPKAIPVVAAAQVRQNLANVKPLPDKEMDKEIVSIYRLGVGKTRRKKLCTNTKKNVLPCQTNDRVS